MPIFKFDVKNDLVLRSEDEQSTVFEPADDNKYNLSYACLLIPRFDNHYLAGDVVEYLYSWMQQICISYGWKLDCINIQSDYMQWVASVAVTIAPAQIIRAVRQHTSEYIFNDFPKYKKQNVGNDFWASAHLVVVGKQLHTLKIIRDFISLTRQQQAAGAFLHKKG